MACKIIVGYGMVVSMLLLLDMTVLKYFKTTGWRLVFFIVALLLFGSALIAKLNHFDKKWIKYQLLISLTVSSAVMHFYGSIFALFFIVCPTVICTSYYNQKFVCQIGAFTCLLLIISDSLNYILEMSNSAIQELHASQMVSIMWGSIPDVLMYETIPRFSVLMLSVYLCTMIAQGGKKMVVYLSQVTQEKTAMESELKAATKIQNSLLPACSFASEKSEVLLEANIIPAKEASGDFYDYLMLDANRFAFLIADVSDKGLGAAMFMMSARNALRISLMQNADLSEAVILANRALAKDNTACMFVTAWIGMIDIRTGAGCYVNLGHPDPILIHRNKTVTFLSAKPDNFLGVFDNLKPKTHFLKLEAGDDLLLYTDGLTDANNANKEMFGEERLKEAVQKSTILAEIVPGQTHSAKQNDIRNAISYVMKEIKAFSPEENQFDDQTALAVRMNTVSSPARHSEFSVKCKPGVGSEICDEVNKRLLSVLCPDDTRRLVDTVINEIADNITEYSHATDDIRIDILFSDNYVTLQFSDNGIPFNPLLQEKPQMDGTPLFGGYGIYIVKSIANDLKYEWKDNRNVLTFTKLWISKN